MPSVDPSAATAGALAPRRVLEFALVLVGAVLLVAVQAQGIAVPSLWYDEAASYSGASRSLPALWEMAQQIDAVHALYYALMHPVAVAFGPDPVLLRLTSTIMVGVAAALVYALARQFGSPWSAAAAALLFAGLGRTAWMATEARSFALTVVLATLLTLLLVLLLRSRSARGATLLAVAYAATAVLGTHVFLYVSLVVVAHVCSLIWIRPARGATTRMLWAVSAAGLACLPLGLIAISQRGQLGGVFEIDGGTWRHVVIGEFFHREQGQGWLAWGLLLVSAGVVASKSGLGRRSVARAGRATPEPATSPAAPSPWPVLLPWLMLPSAAILLISVLGESIFQPRALVLSAPALCVLLAETLRRAFGGVLSLLLSVAVAASGAGAFSANRELTSKNADWPVVVEHLQHSAADGEGVLYSTPIDYRTWPSLIGLVHEREVHGLIDVTFESAGEDHAALFAQRSSSAAAVPRMQRLERVHYVYSLTLSDEDREDDLAALERAGLEPAAGWEGPLTGVETWVRSESGATGAAR